MVSIEEIKKERDKLKEDINKLLVAFQEKNKVDISFQFNYDDLDEFNTDEDKEKNKEDNYFKIKDIDVSL